MNYKNLLLLGATGGIGKWVLKMAREKGYDITVVVRSANKLEITEGIKIIEGDVHDPETIKKAMEGRDAVISCLGIKRKTQNNPWSPLASPTNLAELAIQNVISIMKEQEVNRLITISAAGVGDSISTLSPLMKFMVKRSNIKYTFQDFDRVEKLMKNSGLDSLAIRPVALVDSEWSNKAKIVDKFKMSSKISRAEVAQWMMNSLERPGTYKTSTEMIGW